MNINRNYNIKGICKKVLAYLIVFTGIYNIADKAASLLDREKGLYIFLYHRIGCKGDEYYEHNLTVKMENFLKQLGFFRKKFYCASMTEAVNLLKGNNPLKRDIAVITFDDGYEDNYIKGLELFKKYNIYPAIYLVAGAIENRKALWTEIIDCYMVEEHYRKSVLNYFGMASGKNMLSQKAIFQYAEKIKNDLKKLPIKQIEMHMEYLQKNVPLESGSIKCGLLNWEETSALAAAGSELGGHTLNHINLAAEEEENAKEEIEGAKKLIEERAFITADHFAYPYGKYEHYNSGIIECVKQSYKSAVTAVEGINRIGDDLFQLKRIIISNSQSYLEFKVRLLYFKLRHILKIRRRGRGLS